MYEVFPHTADAGLRVAAADLDELMEDAALGLFSLIIADLDEIRPTQEMKFKVSGAEVEYLLFDWLNELLFTFEHHRLLFCEFTVSVHAEGLEAIAKGEPLDLARHHLSHEVKAITYHDLEVKETTNGWVARVIVDI